MKMKPKYCLYCKKELDIKEGTKQLNPKRIFCNSTCNTRYNAKKRHNRLKDNEEFKQTNRTIFKNWYKNNKDRQKTNVLNNYRNNKEKWNQRRFIERHRQDILKYLNTTCFCGNPVKMIMHRTYGDYPKLTGGPNNKKESNLKLIEEYTKKNLIGVCSKICLNKVKNENNRI
jgi:hypothetical protein